jgi:hypothetical protein
MLINLYSFSKRLNSTLQPAGDGTAVNVSLKEGTSIYSPSFILNSAEAPEANYLKWKDRYYYINDNIYLNKGLYQIDCSMDALATFKSQIQATSAFVLYSSSSYNTDIPDQRLSTKKDQDTEEVSAAMFNDQIGYPQKYIVSYIGNSGGMPIAITEDGFQTLAGKLSDKNLWSSLLANPEDYASRMFNSATDCITGVRYSPLGYVNTGRAKVMYLGSNYLPGVEGDTPEHDVRFTADINIPWKFSDFRNRSQYCSMILKLPGYGALTLNPDNFLGRDSLKIYVHYDAISCDLTYNIDNKINASCNIGYNIQFGTTSANNFAGAASGLMTAVTGAATGNAALTAIGAFNAVMSSMQLNPGSVGSTSGSAAFNADTYFRLILIYHDTTIDPASMQAEIGRPLNAVASMGSLSGYVQTIQFSLAAAAPENILQQIDNLMDGGVYLE